MRLRNLFIGLCLVLAAAGVLGWLSLPADAVTYTFPVQAQPKPQIVSAGGAAQSNAATLTGATGFYTYLEGFDVTGGGASVPTVVEVTTTGLTNNLKYEVAVQAGPTGPINGQGGLSVRFPTPIQSSATNTNIVVTLPSLGTGNANAAITVYGFTAP